MEGAKTLQRTNAGRLESNVFADDISDVDALLYLVNVSRSDFASHVDILLLLGRLGAGDQLVVKSERALVGERGNLINDYSTLLLLRGGLVPG